MSIIPLIIIFGVDLLLFLFCIRDPYKSSNRYVISERCTGGGEIVYNVHERTWYGRHTWISYQTLPKDYRNLEAAMKDIEKDKKWRAHTTRVVKEL